MKKKRPHVRLGSGWILTGHDGVQYIVHALMATATPEFLAKVHPEITSRSCRLRAYVICRMILANRNA